MANAQNTELQIEYQATFFGGAKTTGVHEKQVYGAKDFLKEAIRIKKAKAWTDRQAMLWVRKALKGAALDWWNATYLQGDAEPGVDDLTAEQLAENFTTFECAFRQRFNVPHIKRYYAYDNIKNQLASETPGEYYDRIKTITLEHSDFILKMANTKFVDLSTDETGLLNDWLDGRQIDNAGKAALRQLLTTIRKNSFSTVNKINRAHITKTFFASGLRNKQLRDEALKVLDTAPIEDLKQILKDVLSLHARQEQDANKDQKKAQAAAIEEAPVQDDQPQVEALKQQKQKGKGQKGNGKAKQSQSKTATSAAGEKKLCEYCKMSNHNISTCFKRLRALEKSFAELHGKQLTSPDQVAQTGAQNAATEIFIQPPLNPNGKW